MELVDKMRLTNFFKVIVPRLHTLILLSIWATLFISRPGQFLQEFHYSLTNPTWFLVSVVASIAISAIYFEGTFQSQNQILKMIDLALVSAPLLLIASAAFFLNGASRSLPITLVCLLVVYILWRMAPWAQRQFAVRPWTTKLLPVLLYIGCYFSVRYDAVDLPRFVEPLGVLSIGLGFLGILIHLLLSTRFFLISVLALSTTSFFVGKGRHDLATIVRDESALPETFYYWGEAAAAWIEKRADKLDYVQAKRPYPLIIGVSEGGGIYAGAHSVIALQEMQARCPSFNQHLFALVGVSGGAIGNLVYASEAERSYANTRLQPCGLRPERAKLHSDHMPATAKLGSAIEADYMSPILAAFLFVEPIEALVPWPFGPFDRATVIVDSLRTSLGQNGKFVDRSLTTLVAPDRNFPALLTVSTDVRAGQRIVFSPLQSCFFTIAKWHYSTRS